MSPTEKAERRAAAIREVLDRAPEPTDEQVALVSLLLPPVLRDDAGRDDAPERAA